MLERTHASFAELLDTLQATLSHIRMEADAARRYAGDVRSGLLENREYLRERSGAIELEERVMAAERTVSAAQAHQEVFQRKASEALTASLAVDGRVRETELLVQSCNSRQSVTDTASLNATKRAEEAYDVAIRARESVTALGEKLDHHREEKATESRGIRAQLDVLSVEANAAAERSREAMTQASRATASAQEAEQRVNQATRTLALVKETPGEVEALRAELARVLDRLSELEARPLGLTADEPAFQALRKQCDAAEKMARDGRSEQARYLPLLEQATASGLLGDPALGQRLGETSVATARRLEELDVSLSGALARLERLETHHGPDHEAQVESRLAELVLETKVAVLQENESRLREHAERVERDVADIHFALGEKQIVGSDAPASPSRDVVAKLHAEVTTLRAEVTALRTQGGFTDEHQLVRLNTELSIKVEALERLFLNMDSDKGAAERLVAEAHGMLQESRSRTPSPARKTRSPEGADKVLEVSAAAVPRMVALGSPQAPAPTQAQTRMQTGWASSPPLQTSSPGRSPVASPSQPIESSGHIVFTIPTPKPMSPPTSPAAVTMQVTGRVEAAALTAIDSESESLDDSSEEPVVEMNVPPQLFEAVDVSSPRDVGGVGLGDFPEENVSRVAPPSEMALGNEPRSETDDDAIPEMPDEVVDEENYEDDFVAATDDHEEAEVLDEMDSIPAIRSAEEVVGNWGLMAHALADQGDAASLSPPAEGPRSPPNIRVNVPQGASGEEDDLLGILLGSAGDRRTTSRSASPIAPSLASASMSPLPVSTTSSAYHTRAADTFDALMGGTVRQSLLAAESTEMTGPGTLGEEDGGSDWDPRTPVYAGALPLSAPGPGANANGTRSAPPPWGASPPTSPLAATSSPADAGGNDYDWMASELGESNTDVSNDLSISQPPSVLASPGVIDTDAVASAFEDVATEELLEERRQLLQEVSDPGAAQEEVLEMRALLQVIDAELESRGVVAP